MKNYAQSEKKFLQLSAIIYQSKFELQFNFKPDPERRLLFKSWLGFAGLRWSSWEGDDQLNGVNFLGRLVMEFLSVLLMLCGYYRHLPIGYVDGGAVGAEERPLVTFYSGLRPGKWGKSQHRNRQLPLNSLIFLEKQGKTKDQAETSQSQQFAPKIILLFEYSVSIQRPSLKQFEMIIALQSIQISYQKLLPRIMYFPHTNINNTAHLPVFYFVYPQNVLCYVQEDGWRVGSHEVALESNQAQDGREEVRMGEDLQKSSSLFREKGETCESSDFLEKSKKTHKKCERTLPLCSVSSRAAKTREVKLQYRIEWKNENRNIVPNLINQMISYLLKPSKSARLVQRLFSILPHHSVCSVSRYFQYVKKIRESITHYVNESVFLQFLEIHQPNCELYSLEEQQFYMKVCRIVNLSFLRNEITLISLTSKRMSQAKRKIHLIAREALAEKFVELCQESSQ